MSEKSRRKEPKGNETPTSAIVSDDFIFWFAACVMGYSLLVPLLALESLFLAESVLQFGLVHQAMMVLLVMLAAINLLGKVMVDLWQYQHWLTVVACLMLLISVQPAVECCSNLIAAISGVAPVNTVNLTDVLFHLLPIAGSGWLMCEGRLCGRMASKASQSKLLSR